MKKAKIVRECRTASAHEQAPSQRGADNKQPRRQAHIRLVNRKCLRPPTDFRAELLSGLAEEGGGAAAAAKIFGMTIDPGIDTIRLATRSTGRGGRSRSQEEQDGGNNSHVCHSPAPFCYNMRNQWTWFVYCNADETDEAALQKLCSQDTATARRQKKGNGKSTIEEDIDPLTDRIG